MRLEGRTARMTMLIILFFLVLQGLLASETTPLASTQFSLRHSINVDPVFHFEFRNSSGAVNNVTVPTNASNFNFATLYLVHNRNLSVSSLSVSATDLTCDSDFFPYTMTVRDAQGKTVKWVADPYGHGKGAATFVSSEHPVTYNYTTTEGTAHIADFYITLDDTDVPAGKYTGTVILTFDAGY